MKTTITMDTKLFNAIAITFCTLLVGALVYVLCTGNLSNLSTIGY